MKKPNWLIATALIVAMSCTACSTSPGSTDKSVKHNDSAITSEDTHHHKSSDKTDLEDKSSKDDKKSDAEKKESKKSDKSDDSKDTSASADAAKKDSSKKTASDSKSDSNSKKNNSSSSKNNSSTNSNKDTHKHSYGKGIVTKAATCTEDGVMTFTCKDNDSSYTEAVPRCYYYLYILSIKYIKDNSLLTELTNNI